MEPRSIELLAPARNKECGMEAIRHGADAVYIGASRFGARAAAGNSVEDIAELAAYAHLYHARVYVTVNTILKEEETEEAEQLIRELCRAGADALIIQDMGIMKMNLPPVALHASTQMDNRTTEKVRFLAEAGFRRVVLPRELTLEEIRRIHQACPVPLEVFIHGALCVSYSGQCYMSQACFGRSANRGECAQFCRLPFTMKDADGRTIACNKHLLSLKDLNQSSHIEELLDAGVTSLKIEGRLKELSYVKNITAYYRTLLDNLFRRRREYVRASSGTVRFTFRPQPDKSFNRGFTDYFLKGRRADITSFDTPKSLGERMGTVKERGSRWLTVAGVKPFHNGDGVCYVDASGQLCGFRVNRVEANRLWPQEMPEVAPRTVLYRNYDHEFEKLLARPSAERKIGVTCRLGETAWGFTCSLTDEEGYCFTFASPGKKEEARTPQTANLQAQLEKLGNTPFRFSGMETTWSGNWFVPSSVVSEWRRRAAEGLLRVRRIAFRTPPGPKGDSRPTYPVQCLTWLGNVMNTKAEAFYHEHGVQHIAPAYEKQPVAGAALMYCKHCLRYSMGWCPSAHRTRSPFREPFFLTTPDGKRFRLEFDCKQCLMKVFREEEETA